MQEELKAFIDMVWPFTKKQANLMDVLDIQQGGEVMVLLY